MTDYLIGIQSIQHMLNHFPHEMIEIMVQREQSTGLKNLLNQALEHGIPVQQVRKLPKELEELAHQGLIARIKSKGSRAEQELAKFLSLDKKKLFLVLDCVQDPHNLGACLRVANAAQVSAVIIPKAKSASITPSVRKVACGGAESVPVFEVPNLARTLQALKEAGFWIKGAEVQGRPSLYQCDLKPPLVLVMGHEHQGMRRLTRELCDELFHLPMLGTVESLNVSVATSVCLYEVQRQRHNWS